ncbi:pyk10-binding protein 1 [Moniliophthora roreri MCA 2997]|uniref:Pyk10-binding protein 1 n=2 Tax=Moniliophthora roreri TaxID=221103 RepID=V2WR68_MONRO|nr:pyk10-binding protein 1 [Moniliophthora roreri MCA 2997]
MSQTPSNPPQLPRSVNGIELPDFMNAKIIQRGIKLPFSTVPDRYDFTIKHSDCFGTEAGDPFDEGATWYPLKLVQITSTAQGLSSYQARYAQNVTGLYGKAGDANELKLSLDEDEYITGISGTFTDVVTSLQIRTTKQEQRIGTSSGTQFEFNVPEDHHVVGFFGRADDQLRALGVAYNRRLDSLAKDTVPRATHPPEIKPIYSELYLTAAGRQQWANNDLAAITAKRDQARKELQPIYDNIQKNGENAWALLEYEGDQYYASWTETATVWAYAKDEQSDSQASNEVKTSIISIGSYAMNAEFLGVSGYVWDNLPITIGASLVALTFATLVQPVISEGATWGLRYAASQLASAAASAGITSLAELVPASVASAGGLAIIGIIGIALFLAVIWLADIIFRQYYLTVNVFNFDPDHAWNSITWYDDNAVISNGEWKPVAIPKYSPAGDRLYPPGFDPPNALESVVTYLCIAFTNVNTFLEGLGIGMLMARDDGARGLALKYVVERLSDNEMGLQGITSNLVNFDLSNYYEGDGWVQSNSAQTTVGDLTVTGYTPYLSGAPGSSYEFTVTIGLPPSTL